MHEHRLLQSLPHRLVITYCPSPGGKHSATRRLFSTMAHLVPCLLARSPPRLPTCSAVGDWCLLWLWPPRCTWSGQYCCFPELTASAYSLTGAHRHGCVARQHFLRKERQLFHLVYLEFPPQVSSASIREPCLWSRALGKSSKQAYKMYLVLHSATPI